MSKNVKKMRRKSQKARTNNILKKGRVLLIGEPILDITIPVCLPDSIRPSLGRAEPLSYKQIQASWKSLGGVLYWARFVNFFNEISVVMPRSIGGIRISNSEEILKKLRQDEKISIVPVPVQRDQYEILRFVEIDYVVGEEVPSDFQLPRSLFRVDAGDSSKVDKSEEDSIIRQFKSGYNWLIKGNKKKYIVLADYEIGLFTYSLLNKINKYIKENIEVIVYARGCWQKYAEIFMKGNCTIVADTKTTLFELCDYENKIHTEDAIAENPFRCVKSRYPALKQLVLSDRKETKIGKWNDEEITVWKKAIDYSLLSAFSGHRAIVGATLCISDLINNPLDFLYFSSYATNYCGRVLIGKLEDQQYKYMCEYLNKTRRTIRKNISKTTLKISRIMKFHCHLCKKGAKLELAEFRTKINNVYTYDFLLKKQIEDIVDKEIMELNISNLSCFDEDSGTYVTKLFFSGPPRSGKTYIAKELAKQYFNIRDDEISSITIDCNRLGSNFSAIEEAVEYIEQQVINSSKKIVILNEINNIGRWGSEIQRRLLTRLEDENTSLKRLKRKMKNHITLIFAGSITMKEIKKIKPTDKMNNKDFYSRLDVINLSTLAEREYDSVYMLAQKLVRERKVTHVSLRFLTAVLLDNKNNMKVLKDFINKVLSFVKDERILDDEWFSKVRRKLKLKLFSEVEEGKLIRIIQA